MKAGSYFFVFIVQQQVIILMFCFLLMQYNSSPVTTDLQRLSSQIQQLQLFAVWFSHLNFFQILSCREHFFTDYMGFIPPRKQNDLANFRMNIFPCMLHKDVIRYTYQFMMQNPHAQQEKLKRQFLLLFVISKKSFQSLWANIKIKGTTK